MDDCLEGSFREGIVEIHDSLSSTQVRGKELAREAVCRAIIVADEQTAGRGRLTRRWESPKGSGLYFSLLFRPQLPSGCAHFINIAAALAVEKAVQTVHAMDLQLKWPNDLLLNERKICGILSESACQGDLLNYCVTGIGINLFVPHSLPADVAARTGSLLDGDQGANCDQTELIAEVAKDFFHWINVMEHEGIARLLECYRAKCASVGRTVRVEAQEEILTGTCLGIGEKGELILDTPHGARYFHVADITHATLLRENTN